MSGYRLITPPATEPLALADVKKFCQVDADITADDELIQNVLIPTARQAAEQLTGRALITQAWRRTLDGMPLVLELERAPLQSITAFQYLDMASTWQTVSADVYTVDADTEPGRIALKFGQIWPIVLPQVASVRVDYLAGYGDAATTVPEAFKHWMLMRIRGLWEFRAESVELVRSQLQTPSFVDGLLDRYCVVGA